MTEPIQICRGFTDEHWRMLRKRLNDGDESAWSCAIEVFERRMKERFFSCIEALMNADSKLDLKIAPGAPPDCSTLPDDAGSQVIVPGFAILALCCLLAETLQGFRQSPPKKDAVSGPCTFPQGQCIKPATTDQFREFLHRPAFCRAFDEEKVATRFVNGVRNGIFHEGETRGWVIWRDEPSGKILAQQNGGYAINRTEFYRALKDEFEAYLKELRTRGNASLRARFVKKMTDIAEEC